MIVLAILLLFISAPAAADNGHSGVATPRTAPELSDLALFAMAAGGVWFTRRALRRRARKD